MGSKNDTKTRAKRPQGRATRAEHRAKRRSDRQRDAEYRAKLRQREKEGRAKIRAKYKAQGNFFQRLIKARRAIRADSGRERGPDILTDYQQRDLKKREKLSRREQYYMDTIDYRGEDTVSYISPISIYYVWGIYKQAVGWRRFIPLVNNVIDSIIVALRPIIAGLLINEIVALTKTQDLRNVTVLTLVMALITMFRIILQELSAYSSDRIYQDVIRHVSEQVTLKFIQVPMSVRESSEFADKFSRARDFATQIPYVSSSLTRIISSIFELITVAVAVFAISPFILLVVFISAIPYSIISINHSRNNQKRWRRYSRDARMAYRIQDKLIDSEAVAELELNGLSSHFISRMLRLRRRANEENLAEKRRLLFPSTFARCADSLTSFAVLFVVIIKIMRGQVQIGSFVSIRDLLDTVRSNIYGLFSLIADTGSSLANATDYMDFMQTPNRVSGDIVVEGIPTIEFRHVSFTYPGAKEPTIKDVSFRLDPGHSLAIVGENGAGKTTLIKILIGAYVPQSGEVLVNGHPISEINLESYMEQIGAIFQNFSRYEFATLGENVQFGDLKAKYTKARAQEALRLAGLEGLADKYEHGLDQILSKDYDPKFSAGLSGGQWQRICIARAFYRAPNVLLLDEPTSAVDAKAEYNIFQNIIKNQQGKSTVIISHRFSTVRRAEQIIVLDKGVIAERGTHAELIAQNGIYAEMFNLQAEGYN